MLEARRLFTFALISLFVPFLAACDSNSANEDEEEQPFASFSLEVSGDTEDTMEGFAFFGEAQDPETGEDVFVIYFSETQNVSTNTTAWAFMGRSSGRPAVGTHSIVDLNQGDEEIPDDEFVMIASLGETQAEAITYVSEGGVLNVTESSSSRLEGSFEIDAAGFNFTVGQQLEVSIEGSFDAVANEEVFVPFVQ